VNGNHLGAITAFATRKYLRPEQLTAVYTFAGDPIPVQLGKIFVICLANENTLAKFQAAKLTFEINSALKTNIMRAVNTILCSSNISQYRGETGKNDIQVSQHFRSLKYGILPLRLTHISSCTNLPFFPSLPLKHDLGHLVF
jgi:hypothetical protein